MSEVTEIVRADPVKRRRAIVTVVLVVAALGTVYYFFGNPFDRLFGEYSQEMDELNKTNKEEAKRKAGNVIVGMVVSVWLFVLLVATYSTVLGLRMWSASQWPLPDARLIADRRVIGGRRLRVEAACTIALPIALLIAVSCNALEVIQWVQERP